MAEGVPVVAATSGRVLRTRGDMADVDVREIGLDLVEDRYAGNAVVIDHGGGWETQYSHLRQDSIVVGPGDRVLRGDVLGMIGMSGRDVSACRLPGAPSRPPGRSVRRRR